MAGDTNGKGDMFVYDSVTGLNELVSKATDGTLGNDISYEGAISADGRYVAFDSDATNLVPGYTGAGHIYVRDRQNNTTEIVDITNGGVEGNSWSYEPSISDDGRYVSFYSDASNLVSGDTNAKPDIFVYDRQTDTIERVSLTYQGAQSNDESYENSISADGRYVAFESAATNLVTGDTNAKYDIFIRDRQASTTERVSVDSGGAQADNDSNNPSITSDGRYIVYKSDATNLVTGDTNGKKDIFLYDRNNHTTEQISVNSSEVEGDSTSNLGGNTNISDDGRFVSFFF